MSKPIGSTGNQDRFYIPPAGSVSRDRVEAFGRAARHSRRVRRLKFLLPFTAIVAGGLFAAHSFMSRPVAVSVDAGDTAFAEGKLVMANPKLEGYTKDNRPYQMTAMRAIQDLDQQGVITLEGINARMPVESDNWARVVADNGVYDRGGNTLKLTDNVTVSTDDGMVAKLESAQIDIAAGTLKSEDPVDISRNGSRIQSQTMTILENGKVAMFDGKVRMHIEPRTMKAADAAGGGGDASN